MTAIVPGGDAPQKRDEDGDGPARRTEEDVEGEDVDDDRSEQRESQNTVAVDQQERAGENLNAGNQIDIVP